MHEFTSPFAVSCIKLSVQYRHDVCGLVSRGNHQCVLEQYPSPGIAVVCTEQGINAIGHSRDVVVLEKQFRHVTPVRKKGKKERGRRRKREGGEKEERLNCLSSHVQNSIHN